MRTFKEPWAVGMELGLAGIRASQALQAGSLGMMRYLQDFVKSYMIAAGCFGRAEARRMHTKPPLSAYQDHLELLMFSADLGNKALQASMETVGDHSRNVMAGALCALFNTFFGDANTNTIAAFMAEQAESMRLAAQSFPEAIQRIKSEYGFHFDNGGYVCVAETEHFYVYQVLPLNARIQVRKNGKPILIIPPYVLGANILAFLPGENKSYVHCFANQGIPTYIRILKDIGTHAAVQTMTAEDDARDTRLLCEQIMSRHGKPVTLNGYCQGGYTAVCNMLSGELDELVDALITCVAPMDGTRSRDLANFLKGLPQRFNHLDYGTKILPNGNQVADGQLMSWVYKLKSMEKEFWMVEYLRDLMMMAAVQKNGGEFNKTILAINYWLKNERSDIPLAITKMSFDAYNTPVAPDGTLPVRLFGRKLNFKRLQAKGIKWLICYGAKDELVEEEVTLAPLDYIDSPDVTKYPGGHVKIATSWSLPTSDCALHEYVYSANPGRKMAGPVRYQLNLEEDLRS